MLSIFVLVQDVSAPGGEVKSHAFKSQKLKVLNPLPTNETNTCIIVWLKTLLDKGYKMC